MAISVTFWFPTWISFFKSPSNQSANYFISFSSSHLFFDAENKPIFLDFSSNYNYSKLYSFDLSHQKVIHSFPIFLVPYSSLIYRLASSHLQICLYFCLQLMILFLDVAFLLFSLACGKLLLVSLGSTISSRILLFWLISKWVFPALF